jgi:hypothetical protein
LAAGNKSNFSFSVIVTLEKAVDFTEVNKINTFFKTQAKET